MDENYVGREQSATKHLILKNYLETLSFKVLYRNWNSLTFIDAFSGPWSSRSSDYSDTSFMIALTTLARVKNKLLEFGRDVEIRCFLTEKNAKAFVQLEEAVENFQSKNHTIKIMLRNAEFLDVIEDACDYARDSFKLTFIDPTGWTGFSLPILANLIKGRNSETLVNYMHDFINRAVAMKDEKTRASLEPILGESWWETLPSGIPKGEACEQLFRSNLKEAGDFKYVLSTKIDRVSSNRPHFFLAFGTNSFAGVREFRETERKALNSYGEIRAKLKSEKLTDNTTGSLFGEEGLPIKNPFEDVIKENIQNAEEYLVECIFAIRPENKFHYIVEQILQRFPVRETEVKDICVKLAKEGKLLDTWSQSGLRKPRNDTMIKLPSTSI